LANEPEPERTRRDSLLLELGALVYELHRRGRRAPELLQKKAAELDALEEPGDETDVDRNSYGQRKADDPACPACGEAAAPDQLVCLECGTRLALDREQQQAGRAGALAALIAVVIVGAGAAGFALSELTSGSGDGEQVQRTAKRLPPTETETAPEPKRKAKGTPQKPKRSLLLKWPAGLTAHTVILVNAEDRGSARRVAIEAARTGLEAGVLRSEDYDLGSGLWVVFAGRFDTRRGAERQAEDLSLRYPGTYVQLIEPRSQ
jgi:predicted nucleic acid-binding Zn ribbon protein